MSVFRKPEIIRNGADIEYRFIIEKSEISTTLDSKFINASQSGEIFTNNPGYEKFIADFLLFANSFFSKKYTLISLKKYLKHKESFEKLTNNINNTIMTFTPEYFSFTQHGVVLNWKGSGGEADVFELPELLESTGATSERSRSRAHSQSKTSHNLESIPAQTSSHISSPNVTPNIPIQFEPKTSKDKVNSEEVEEIELDGHEGSDQNAPMIDLEDDGDDDDSEDTVEEMARSVARSKVREARLKAKIARMKAERSTVKYLQKYGATYSDLDDSESEHDTQRGSDTDDSSDWGEQ